MKLHPSKKSRQSGAALLLVAIILIFSLSVMTAYLLLSQGEYASTARSQNWNNSMSLTEAGVEDALAFMNKYDGDLANVQNWSTAASAAQDGWTVNGNLYTMHRTVGTNMGYYDVTIDNTFSNAPVINCTGTATMQFLALNASSSPFFVATIGLPSSSTAVRSVKVRATYSALFPGAIITKTNIDLNGNNVRVDSFNSTSNTMSIWNSSLGYGTYGTSIARAHGDVFTDSSLVGAISIGQANIYGHVDTGPGGTATVGNNGYAGPLPQSGSGIQPGYSRDDMNTIFPDVVLPSGAGSWQSVPSSGVITNSGNYYTVGIYGNLTINAPNVTIYVNGSINLSGQQAITIAANGYNVNMYVAGPSISLTGQATINNLTQDAHYLGIYGLPTLTSINFGGNAAYTGTIYAPEANFSFGGGGNNTYDFVGSLIANNCVLNGHANFHYDESLKVFGPGLGYIPSSWQETTSPGK